MTTIGVLALQGDFEEHATMLGSLGVNAVQVRLPEQLAGLDGLILPGGESTTIARLMHEWGLMHPVRGLAREGMGLWGTCAGAILLAANPGDLDRDGLRVMDISIERNAFGRQVDSFEIDLDVAVLGPPPFRAVFIRAPAIRRVGPAVEVIASLPDGIPAAVREGSVMATAFHPELTNDARLHRYFVEQVCGAAVSGSPPHPDGVELVTQ